MGAIETVVAAWHEYLRGDAPDGLDDLLADDVVFYSPIVYTPQRGKALTAMYLEAARQTFPGDEPSSDAAPSDPAPSDAAGPVAGSFRYTKKVLSGDTAVLEFETTVDGRYVNGVDIIRCDDDARIVEFRVMLRPLQAVELMHRKMGEMLASMTTGGDA